MVLKISYQIRFPLGAEFQSDPKYLFIQKIYTSIKRILCIETKIPNCFSCTHQDHCLYYFLSGEDFKYFPGILVDRNQLEKKMFDKRDTLLVTFYLIGLVSEYVAFIDEYFNTTQELVGVYFQKHLVEIVYLNDSNVYNGELEFTGLLKDIKEIEACIRYYNQKYNCHYLMPIIQVISQGSYIRDFNHYHIGTHYFHKNGYKMKIVTQDYPNIFKQIGIGKCAFIGGGKANEGANSIKFDK